jgi:hypothetical protein
MTSQSCFRSISLGRLTQRLECHPHTVEVAGSNPAPPITNPAKRRVRGDSRFRQQ